MSWYGVPIFRCLPDGSREDAPWVDLVDSLDEAAAYLQRHPGHVAYEVGGDGQPTGVVLRVDRAETAFLAD